MSQFLYACISARFGKSKENVFVQPIDDVDTAIKQGWPILETLRRYLATPHLIKILTGDIDLYETLVRKQQIDKLSNLLKNENKIGGDVGKIGKQISHITEQYFAKVIPSHLRVTLKPIANYIAQEVSAEDNKFLVSLKFDEGDKKILLNEIYQAFAKDLFGIDRIGWIDLLPIITRDLVRFFKALKPWYDQLDKEISAENKIDETLEAMVQIFNAALYNGNISSNDLLLLKKGQHLEWLGDYCLNHRQEAQELWRLFPRYDDEEWNYRALLLNAFLFQGWKAFRLESEPKELLYPHAPMSYGIKVLLPCLLADSHDLTGEKLIEIKRLLDIGNTERHFWMAMRSLAYRLRDNSYEWSTHGSGYVYVKYKPEFVIEWTNGIGWFCHFMYRPNNGIALYADILIAIARLVDVLGEGSDLNEDGLSNLFKLFVQDRVWYLHSEFTNNIDFKASGSVDKVSIGGVKSISYQISDFKLQHINNTCNFKKISINAPINPDFEMSAKDMRKWITVMKTLEYKKILPPSIIARIWKRFIDNLEYIRSDIEIMSEGIPSNPIELTNVIKCWIKAFLNAILIEELIIRRGNEKHNINIENIRFSNKDVFYGNLSLIKDFSDIYYTQAWINCPLFWLFLDDDMPNNLKIKLEIPTSTSQ